MTDVSMQLSIDWRRLRVLCLIIVNSLFALVSFICLLVIGPEKFISTSVERLLGKTFLDKVYYV